MLELILGTVFLIYLLFIGQLIYGFNRMKRFSKAEFINEKNSDFSRNEVHKTWIKQWIIDYSYLNSQEPTSNEVYEMSEVRTVDFTISLPYKDYILI